MRSMRQMYEDIEASIDCEPTFDAVYLKTAEIGTQKIYGYLNYPGWKPQYFGTKNAKKSKWFQKFLECYPHYKQGDLNYKWIFTNPVNLLRAAAKFGTDRKAHMNYNILNDAVAAMVKHVLGPMIDSCDILTPDQIPYVASSSTGPVGKYLHSGDKGDFYNKYHDWWQPYWDSAHLVDYLEVWKEFGKEEEVKYQKWVDDDIRSICSPSPLLSMFGSCLEQDFNKKYMKQVFGIGWSKWYRGVNKLADKLKNNNERGDAKKWDRSMVRLAFAVIFYYRWKSLRSEYRTKENFMRLLYATRQKVNTLRVLPNLQLLLKDEKNPSGSWSTSTDNDLWHRTIRIYTWCKLTGLPADDYFKHCSLVTYGDDYVESSDDFALNNGYIAEAKVECYAECGVELVLESPSYIRGPEGVEFLGGKIIKTPHGYAMVPARPDKIYVSLYEPPRDETLNLALTRAAQLWVESAFCPHNESMLKDYVQFLQQHGAHLVDDPMSVLGVKLNKIPTRRSMMKLWFGDESR